MSAELQSGRRDPGLWHGRRLRNGSGQFGHRCHSPPRAQLRTADRSNRFGGDIGGVPTLLEAELVPFSKEHVDSTAAAFVRLGRRRHPAALNFEDWMSYAVASTAGMPLLFTGEKFSRTEIAHAWSAFSKIGARARDPEDRARNRIEIPIPGRNSVPIVADRDSPINWYLLGTNIDLVRICR